MATADPTFEGSVVGAMVAVYEASANGQTSVPILTKMSKVLLAIPAWKGTPSNATFGVYVYSISGGTVNVRCTHADETTTFALLVIGLP